MAKSKAKSKVEEDEDLPEEVADEEPEAEAEPADVEAEEEEPEPDAAEEGRRMTCRRNLSAAEAAALTKTAIALILLNWIMAPAFLTVAYMDHHVRTQYSYRTLVNHISVWGLPLKSEEDSASIWNETRPRLSLTSDQIKSVLKLRPGAKIPSEQFVPVDEPLLLRLRPSDMIDDLVVRPLRQFAR